MNTIHPTALIRASWCEVQRQADDFSETFYDTLFSLDPTLEPMFRTDLALQRRRLVTMITVAVDLLDQPDALMPALRDLGKRHGGYGVRDPHYATVGAALLVGLGATLGAAFTPAVRAAWTDTFGVISSVMMEAARPPVRTMTARVPAATALVMALAAGSVLAGEPGPFGSHPALASRSVSVTAAPATSSIRTPSSSATRPARRRAAAMRTSSIRRSRWRGSPVGRRSTRTRRSSSRRRASPGGSSPMPRTTPGWRRSGHRRCQRPTDRGRHGSGSAAPAFPGALPPTPPARSIDPLHAGRRHLESPTPASGATARQTVTSMRRPPAMREGERSCARPLQPVAVMRTQILATLRRIDSDRLDYYHRLERERIHLLLLEDVKLGLADIAAGRTEEADAAIARLQQQRKATAKTSKRRG